ncbi:uncharacterized protein LOC121777179 isoform X2 [Salvia splendens]|uniref:uncharacterized protein LOC121777179 isoform X2 n=2 Tax=Salvia splendens TaxID=180675 RepID=UPI001C25A294|nr:uncharacterized protein LOC121777179 isoform X2 [Salvia splendens]
MNFMNSANCAAKSAMVSVGIGLVFSVSESDIFGFGFVIAGIMKERARRVWDYDDIALSPQIEIPCSDTILKMVIERGIDKMVGVTPEGVEVPRSLVDGEMQEKLKSMPVESQPSTPPGPDPKWRYMWRIGSRPSSTRFKELNSEPVIPEGFPVWKDTMDSWGSKMVSAIEVVAEMAAVGFGLQKDAFTSLMIQGPHLLAPTGSNLRRHGHIGTVFAGYHNDLNFLTIHGRSRFPGLNIWLRNGQKMEVKVPVGCLLIQTGKQIEWLTGGECIAGMHEVVVTDRTIEAMKLASEQNRSLWRVSSTLFGHIASDAVLKQLSHFADSPLACKYPPMCGGEFVELELAVINLKGSKEEAS